MKNVFEGKVIKNKSNGQFNLSLPKKKISKELIEDFKAGKKLKITVEEWK